MLKALKDLFVQPGSAAALPPQFPPVQVDHPLYIVGDIHGCYDLMIRLLDKINADFTNRPGMGAPKLVFVGDFIDRGDQSAQVLQHVYDMARNDPETIICLMGNHEKMMLDFLNDPARRGGRWLRYGGLQTLASYGVRGINERSDGDQLHQAADALHAALPSGLHDWLQGLACHYQTGNLTCVHAGLDPHIPIPGQKDGTKVWGHKDFMTQPRQDGCWVAHGHIIVDHPGVDAGRIALDTGAYATGRLTAIGLDGTDHWLLTA